MIMRWLETMHWPTRVCANKAKLNERFQRFRASQSRCIPAHLKGLSNTANRTPSIRSNDLEMRFRLVRALRNSAFRKNRPGSKQ
jgi:hypothetical protein